MVSFPKKTSACLLSPAEREPHIVPGISYYNTMVTFRHFCKRIFFKSKAHLWVIVPQMCTWLHCKEHVVICPSTFEGPWPSWTRGLSPGAWDAIVPLMSCVRGGDTVALVWQQRGWWWIDWHARSGYVLPTHQGAGGRIALLVPLGMGGSASALITDPCGGVGSSLN